MKLVAGLGNPGSQYAHTRHNVGYDVVDRLAQKLGWNWSERRSRALLASGTINGEKVILIKPMTFMNLSGESVGELARWYKASPQDLLVICDDLDLPVGKIRLKGKGSSGGQKGLNNIIQHLHTDQIARLRVGIGRPQHQRDDTVKYVLGTPRGDEAILMDTALDRAVEAAQQFLSLGVEATMNLVNADPESQQKAEEKRRKQQERQEKARKLHEEALAAEAAEKAAQTDQKPAPSTSEA